MRQLACLVAGLLLAVPPLRAASLNELISAGKLELDSSLDLAHPAVPGQKVKLRIDVATDSWFAGGTRIELPEVPGLVVLQSEAFAINSTENRRGQSWVQQRWTLDVYATQEGDYTIGPVALQLHIASDGDIASGTVHAPVTRLIAATPASLGSGSWVASPQFDASQSLSADPARLRPGDAITRTITLNAEDVLDKMLPVVEAQSFEGLAAYPRPARLSTQNNRGQSTAQRIQAITYIAEQPGQYTLPRVQFTWWDTGNAAARVVTLDAVELTVQGAAPAGQKGGNRQRLQAALPTAGVVLAGLLACFALYRYLPWQTTGRMLRQGSARLRSAWRRWRAPALPERMNPWH